MIWKRKPPTENGWYWAMSVCRGAARRPVQIFRNQFIIYYDKYYKVDPVLLIGWEKRFLSKDFVYGSKIESKWKDPKYPTPETHPECYKVTHLKAIDSVKYQRSITERDLSIKSDECFSWWDYCLLNPQNILFRIFVSTFFKGKK